MSMEWGVKLRVTVFGSSHGPEVGARITGIPAGTPLDPGRIQADLDRRRPVQRRLATRRQEEDRLVIDSGLVDGRSDGSEFRAHVANTDVQRAPYDRLRWTPRPGHADYPARVRYGEDADLSGGGIFSGRMTVGLVIAGSLARQMLAARGIQIAGFTQAIGGIEADVPDSLSIPEVADRRDLHEVGTADPTVAEAMAEAIAAARREGDSLGGIVEVRATGVPVGLGEPFFDSIESVVAHAAFSVPAVKGVEFGAGFRAARMRGSEHNDPFRWVGDRVETRTNHAGGILGGLATGMPLRARFAVKPTSSIARPQATVDLQQHTDTTITVTGRHDPCIVPRAVVVLESVTAMALADLALRGGFWP
ncbi:MAG: chorismate synthase [Thermoplasmata archaeon]